MKRLIVLLLLLTPWVMPSMEPQEVKPKEMSTETLLKRCLEGGGRWVKLVEEVLPGYIPPSSRISQLIAQKILGRSSRKFILSHVSLPFKAFVGHTNRVRSAMFNPADDKTVTSSSDGTARIWNTAGELLYTLKGHTDSVWSVAFNPASDKIVTGSSDGTARIWNIATGELIHTLKGHTGPVWSAAFNPAGNKVVTASSDRTARIWNTATGELIHTLKGHTKPIESAAFNPAGDKVVTCSDDGTARIWDVEPLFSSEKFLAEDITLRQVAILNDIAELGYVKALQIKAFEKGASKLNPESITFDFNQYPHLWEDYNALPEAIKGVFDSYVTKLSPSTPEQAPRGWCWPY